MNTLVHALSSLLAIGVLWWYLWWLYRDLRVDQFRQAMFALRDEMFDDAAEGRLSFDDRAYGTLRVTANGFIRFGHIISLTSLLVVERFAFRAGNGLPSQAHRLETAIDEAPEGRRALYEKYRQRIHRLVVRHAIINSTVFLLAVWFPTSLYHHASSALDRLTDAFKRRLDEMDAVVYVAADNT